MTECLKLVDHSVGELLINAADIQVESKQFLERNKDVLETIDSFRTAQAENMQHYRSLILAFAGAKDKKMDFFGLPVPSDFGTSEPEI